MKAINLYYSVTSFSILITFSLAYIPFNDDKTRRSIKFQNNENQIEDDVLVYTSRDGLFNFASGNDILSMIQNVYIALSERMDSLEDSIMEVGEKITNVAKRLNQMDCYDIKIEDPRAKSGVYTIHLDYKGKRPVKVYCDMVTLGGGWTIIQQRLPRKPKDPKYIETNFIRNYHDYQVGFGPPENDYWVGLENIYQWTNTRHYELRIELQDFNDDKTHAHYTSFYIDGEKGGYKLHVSGYKGEAGDSLSSDTVYDNFTSDGMLFSTPDQDHDTSYEINCSQFWNIGGWWFNRCSWANLNGPYKFQIDEEDCIGINWHKWRNKQCLKAVKMMIRPRRTK